MAFVSSGRTVHRSRLGRIGVVTLAGLAVLAFSLATLERLGVGAGWILGSAAVTTLLLYAGLGLGTGTSSPSAFFVADRRFSSTLAGTVAAAGCLSSFGTIGLVGAFYGLGSAGFVLPLSLIGGVVLFGLLFAPYLRRAGAYGIADFIGARYDWRARVLAALVIVPACVLLVVPPLRAVGDVGRYMFGVPIEIGLWCAIGLVVLGTIAGGIRSVAATGTAQALVLFVGFIAPLVLYAVNEFGTFFPTLALGDALSSIAARADALLMVGDITGMGEVEPEAFDLMSAGQLLASVLGFAIGFACLPPLVSPHLAAQSGSDARKSSIVAAIFLLLLLIAAPAYATFEKLALLEWLVGLPLTEFGSDAAAWALELGRNGALEICGAAAVSADAVEAACARLGDHGGFVRWRDIGLASDAVLAAAPRLLGLSTTETAMLAVGLLAAGLAGAGAALFAAARALGGDLLAEQVPWRITRSLRMLLARLSILALALLAVRLATSGMLDGVPVLSIALSLLAGGLLPALVCGIWWERATPLGGCAAILAGVGATVVMLLVGGRLSAVSLGEGAPLAAAGADQALVIPGVTSGAPALVGIAAGFAALIVVSLLTRPDPEGASLSENVRVPQRLPLMHRDEV